MQGLLVDKKRHALSVPSGREKLLNGLIYKIITFNVSFEIRRNHHKKLIV